MKKLELKFGSAAKLTKDEMKTISGGVPCNASVDCYDPSGFLGWVQTGRPVSGCIELGQGNQDDACVAYYGGVPGLVYSGGDCECLLQ